MKTSFIYKSKPHEDGIGNTGKSRLRRLEGMRIVITAAAQGIGPSASLACANQGALVTAVDIDANKLAELATHSPNITTAIVDLRDDDAIERFAIGLPAQNGLSNCVGIVRDGTIMDCGPMILRPLS